MESQEFKAIAVDEKVASSYMGGTFWPGHIAKKVFGEVLSYGNLLAYMIRRFGYPSHGSDSYKAIASWYLTTPLEGIYLLVNIKASDTTSLHFGIGFNEFQRDRIREVESEYCWAFEKARDELAAKDGISIFQWPPAKDDKKGWEKFFAAYNKWEAEHRPQYKDTEFSKLPKETQEELEDGFWGYMFEMADKYGEKVNKKDLPRRPRERDEAGNVIYTHPAFVEVEAALETTLRDLLRPTYVRDVCINVLGEADDLADSPSIAEPWEFSGYGIEPSYFDRYRESTSPPQPAKEV